MIFFVKSHLPTNITKKISLSRMTSQMPSQGVEMREAARAGRTAQVQRARAQLRVREVSVRGQATHVHEPGGAAVAEEPGGRWRDRGGCVLSVG